MNALSPAPVPALLASALLLGACSVGPDYVAPVLNLPLRWANASGSAPMARAPEPDAPVARSDLAEWWKGFHDPLLDALVEEAVAGNLDVTAARAAIREARASLRQRGALLAPEVDAGASAARTRSGGGPDGESRTRNSFRAGFDAGWELDLFGGNSRAVEAATRGLEVAENDLRATLLTLVGEVTDAYVQLRGYQARIALARRTAASQRATAALTRGLFDAGSASAMDLSRATAQAASTEAVIPALEAAYADTLHRLGVLLGQPPAALAARIDPVRPIPVPGPMPAAGVPADLLLARPDLRAAERQVAQATALIGQAEAQRYPSVSLSGTLSTSALRIGDLAKSSAISWSAGPSVSLPIFDAGERAAAVEGTQALRDRYLALFRSAVLQALREVESALVALGQERIRAARLAEAANANREAAQLSRTLFRTGASGFLDVLDAERSLYSSEDALLVSRIAIATDTIALHKALGGGWDGAIDTTTPDVVDRMGPRLRRAAAR